MKPSWHRAHRGIVVVKHHDEGLEVSMHAFRVWKADLPTMYPYSSTPWPIPMQVRTKMELIQAFYKLKMSRKYTYVNRKICEFLTLPFADTGIDKPSLLEWRQRDDLKSDHVVIGPDVPGGAWRVSECIKFMLTCTSGLFSPFFC